MTEQPEFEVGGGAPQDLEQRLNDIESSVLKEVEMDARLENGVPDSQKDSDLDFIQMTGLTVPSLLEEEPAEEPEVEEAEPLSSEAPVSFFEEGVGDVDSTLAPTSLELDPKNDEELVASPSPATVAPEDSDDEDQPDADYVSELKDLIEDIHDLEVEEDEDETPAGQVAAVETGVASSQLETEEAEPVTDEDILQTLLHSGVDAESVAEEASQGEEPESDSPASQTASFSELTRELEQLESPVEEAELEDAPDEASPAVEESPASEALSAFDVAAIEYTEETEAPPEAPEVLDNAPAQLEQEDLDLPGGLEALPYIPPQEAEPLEDSAIAEAEPLEDPAIAEAEPLEDPAIAEADAERSADQETIEPDALSDLRVPPASSPISSIPSELAEAETLLQALEAQERVGQAPLAKDDFENFSMQLSGIPTAINRESLAYEANDEDGESTRRRRRGMKHKKNWDERLARWFLRLVVLCVIGGGAYLANDYYRQMTSTPGELFQRGTRLMEDERYAEASVAFSTFVRRYPDDFQAPDAQFNAAYALSVIPSAPWERAHAAYEESERLFDVFVEQNPDHKKRARAETIKGTLLYKLERYEDAIRILSDSRRRMEDPDAYLPSLRCLARSYAKLGKIEEAQSAFLRAASLEANLEPDKDFLELAILYRTLAEGTTNHVEEEEYRAMAVVQWRHALTVPALPALKKRQVQSLINGEEALLVVLRSSDPDAQEALEGVSTVSVEDSALEGAASVVGKRR